VAKLKTAPSDRNTITLSEAQKADLAEIDAKCIAIKLEIADHAEAALRAESAQRQGFDRLYSAQAEKQSKIASIALLSGIDVTKPDHGWDYVGDKFVRAARPTSETPSN
jgi:hypothetical protein